MAFGEGVRGRRARAASGHASLLIPGPGAGRAANRNVLSRGCTWHDIKQRGSVEVVSAHTLRLILVCPVPFL